MMTARSGHGCFSAKNRGNVTHVYAFGGRGFGFEYLKTTEVMDVNYLVWSYGPSLPIGIVENRGVESFDDIYDGFSIGGRDTEDWKEQSVIYGLKNTNGNKQWLRVGSMNNPRWSTTAINAASYLLPSY